MYVTHLYIFLNVKINNISFTLFFAHFFLATRNENRKKFGGKSTLLLWWGTFQLNYWSEMFSPKNSFSHRWNEWTTTRERESAKKIDSYYSRHTWNLNDCWAAAATRWRWDAQLPNNKQIFEQLFFLLFVLILDFFCTPTINQCEYIFSDAVLVFDVGEEIPISDSFHSTAIRVPQEQLRWNYETQTILVEIN